MILQNYNLFPEKNHLLYVNKSPNRFMFNMTVYHGRVVRLNIKRFEAQLTSQKHIKHKTISDILHFFKYELPEKHIKHKTIWRHITFF